MGTIGHFDCFALKIMNGEKLKVKDKIYKKQCDEFSQWK